MLKNSIRTFNYCWNLFIPFGMAATAIWFESPYSLWFIWGGWIVFMLHILLFGQIKKVIWEELPVMLPYFILRIPLILLIPSFNDFLTIKDYFYSEVLAETVSIILILIGFMFLYKENGEPVYKQAGLVINLMAVSFMLVSLFPFVITIYEHYIRAGKYSLIYAAAILIPSLFFQFRLLKRYVSGDISKQEVSQGYSDDQASVMIVVAIVAWLVLLSILYALKVNEII
jgi:hypothetical protein